MGGVGPQLLSSEKIPETRISNDLDQNDLEIDVDNVSKGTKVKKGILENGPSDSAQGFRVRESSSAV